MQFYASLGCHRNTMVVWQSLPMHIHHQVMTDHLFTIRNLMKFTDVGYFLFRDHLLSLLYVVFLIIFVSALCFKSWNFRDNYRESKYIGVLMAVTVPVWLAWNMAALILHESFHAACLGTFLKTMLFFFDYLS